MSRDSIFISAVNNVFSNGNGGGDNSKANQIISGNGEHFFLWWQPTEESMRNLGHLMAITSIILLVVTILGVYLMVTSLIGNSGEQRSKGAGMAIGGFVSLLILRISVIYAAAFAQVSKAPYVALIIISQLLYYIGPPILFVLSSHWLMLGEMTNTNALERRSTKAFNSMLVLMIFGIVAFFIAEVI
ncbi:hypothetical protein [Limosilactobacillus ingluviei]|uniref:Yip1 domain-containing protein n=1 Tax=Limosilactobacillus ingluviei TaxID=148604 RepID=A0A0R2H1X9_9LACO|nr:hypothetical protein [Limosilactobacillus ingluviei]KRN44044.1 hypothetical protein IV41_GL000887 [Limosilactobacillus ingluviei]